jgi:hypothetical protein
MRSYKLAVLVGFAFVLVMAAGARAAGQEWSLSPNEPPAVIRGGAADAFENAPGYPQDEDMTPASSSPAMGDEEMAPSTTAPDEDNGAQMFNPERFWQRQENGEGYGAAGGY